MRNTRENTSQQSRGIAQTLGTMGGETKNYLLTAEWLAYSFT